METQEQTESKSTAKRKATMVVPPVDAVLPPTGETDQNQLNVLLSGDPALSISTLANAPTLSREAIEGTQVENSTGELSPELQFALQVGRLESRLTMLEVQLSLLLERPEPSAALAEETIQATMVGSHFNCPECGLRITTPALIATQGKLTGGYYEHPFGGSPRLGDMPCRLMGKKFYSPVVTLKLVQNLTAKQ